MIIPRISEAIDEALLDQGLDLTTVDCERLAVAAIAALAGQMAREGFAHPATWLRSQIVGEPA
jgi:hypothetical protein